jgi:hypothetical protein
MSRAIIWMHFITLSYWLSVTFPFISLRMLFKLECDTVPKCIHIIALDVQSTARQTIQNC